MLNFGFPCPGRTLAGLGSEVWAVLVGGNWLVHQDGARAGVPRSVLMVLISGSGLAWASLGMGGLQGFEGFFCFAVGQTMHPHFLRYCKYSIL